MQLYKISNNYLEILNNLTDENGELDEIALATIEKIEELAEDKIIAVASYIKNLEAQRDAITVARKEMAAREAALTKRTKWLTDYLRSNMQTLCLYEVTSSPYFAIKLKRCPPSVEVTNEIAIPKEYFNIKEVITVDKVTIKKELQNGVEIPGVTLKYNTRLEIK